MSVFPIFGLDVDKEISVPLKNTNWDPYNKQPPPPPPAPRASISTRPSISPPPSRSSISSPPPVPGQGAPPPPIKRSTRPPIRSATAGSPSSSVPSLPPRGSPASSYHSPPAEPEIDWTNLSPEDKQVFFGWLDEFFERSYGIPASSQVNLLSSSVALANVIPVRSFCLKQDKLMYWMKSDGQFLHLPLNLLLAHFLVSLPCKPLMNTLTPRNTLAPIICAFCSDEGIRPLTNLSLIVVPPVLKVRTAAAIVRPPLVPIH